MRRHRDGRIWKGVLLAALITLALGGPAPASWDLATGTSPLGGYASRPFSLLLSPPLAWYASEPLSLPLSPSLYALAAIQAAASTPGQPSNFQISGVVQYRLFNDPYPPVAGGANLNALTPTPAFPTLHDGILETAITWKFSPNLSLFADLTLENTTGADFSPSDIEETYLEARNLFGLTGSDLRIGRDRVKLGFTGLLIDETVFDGGRRDGVDAKFAQLGPVSLFGFMQYALDDGLQVGNWSSSRRAWGGSAEVQLAPGWAVNVSVRADTAGAGETGTCPGLGCNVGTGWSAGIEGTVSPGITLTMEAATYTQSGDVARWYYEPTLVLDLQQLLALPAQPVLTLWYKSFDPYTAPLDAPLGHLLLPADFSAFNTNDNLTGVGGRLDVSLTPRFGVFLLAEWGSYKGGGPNYSVYSVGAKYNISSDTLIKISYNSYLVDRGVVTTSPITGLQLSNAQVTEVELSKTF